MVKMALFNPCMKFEKILGQMSLFEVLRRCRLGTLSKIYLRLSPTAYPIGQVDKSGKNAFCLGFLWIPRQTGRQNWKGPIFQRFNLIELQCRLTDMPKSGGAMAPPGTAGLLIVKDWNFSHVWLKCWINILNNCAFDYNMYIFSLFFTFWNYEYRFKLWEKITLKKSVVFLWSNTIFVVHFNNR